MKKVLFGFSFLLLLIGAIALSSDNGVSLGQNESDLPFEHSIENPEI
ncbi:hypothetical protein [Rossellomorea sp. NS-SX7]